MITIAIFSTTRAEFGIFIPLINKIIESDDLDYKLFVGGTHLKNKYGKTINERGLKITEIFDYLIDDDSSEGLAKSAAKASYILASIFKKESFDFVCILGDRYELLSIIQTAMIFRKPIIHIHGGEETQGAIDEQIRHMITKAAHIHFVSCDEHYHNVRRMGEQEWRIFNTGALVVENIKELASISKEEIFNSLNLDENIKTVLLTYHPVTLEKNVSTMEQITNIFSALEDYDLQVLITAPNMDTENNVILQEIKNRTDNKKYIFVKSLGVKKYLSLLLYTDFVIGNSSSGILEVPYFKIPSINIGSRQDGRTRHESIIDTDYNIVSIKQSIEKALSGAFREKLKKMPYKFGCGNSSQTMTNSIRKLLNHKNLLIKKLDFPC